MIRDEFDAMVERPVDGPPTTGRIPTLDDYAAALAVLTGEQELHTMKTQTLALGDPCPACGDELKAVRIPTDDQFRKSIDRENPVALPAGVDTAPPDQRAELGALYRCRECGYQARFKGEPADDANGAASKKKK